MYYPRFFVLLLLLLGSACAEKATEGKTATEKERSVSQEFKDYWYQGKAEITSYSLQQERYGEMREGTAVLIFVTEEFLPEIQVKANQNTEKTINVLKLNSTKNYITGIYPYSVMTSTFFPVLKEGHALKVSHSTQEWCGHVYAQINNRDAFEVTSHSYFEGEADENFTLKKDWLEDELWTLLRIDPQQLPTGKIKVIPSLEYVRLRHKELKPMNAVAAISLQDTLSSYTVEYPEANRSLRILFTREFPHTIEKWEETIDGKTSTAVRKQQIKSDYWDKNQNQHEHLRDSLAL